MADGIVGQALTRRFRTGISGQTLTIDADTTTDPSGTAWTPTLTNDPDGSDAWEIAFTPDQAGVWVAEVTDEDNRRYRDEYDILAAPTKTFTRVTSGRVFRSADINQLQQAIEELPF